jgi:hypothetical protein
VSFYNGFLNFTNWSGNVILPTVAGLFFALAIFRFSKGQPYSHALYSGLLALMASGLLRAFEKFASQRAWNDPDVYWISIVTLVDWVGNVLMPIYAAIEVTAGGLALATGERIHHSGIPLTPGPSPNGRGGARLGGWVRAGGRTVLVAVGHPATRRVLRPARRGRSELEAWRLRQLRSIAT